MNAPDKIYLMRYNNLGISAKWSEEHQDTSKFLIKAENIAYIRKDILLEWVNEMGKCSPSVALLAHELIRKINAL